MTYKPSAALIASLCAVTLMVAANGAFAASAGAPHGAVTAARPMPHVRGFHSFRPHRRFDGGFFWPGSFDYGPSYAEPYAEVPPPPESNDVHYTYTYDVPWDWAHRFPPMVAPSDHPYVPSCPSESVTVPGRDGGERTVNVIRCY
jgi:hypothetical protein